MIATLRTDQILVGLIVLGLIVTKLLQLWLLRVNAEPRRRQEIRSAVTFRSERPYDWEKESSRLG